MCPWKCTERLASQRLSHLCDTLNPDCFLSPEDSAEHVQLRIIAAVTNLDLGRLKVLGTLL